MTRSTSAQDQHVPALLADYAPKPGVADELMLADGTINPVWQRFVSYLGAQSPDRLAQRFARGDQYLHDAGVLYRQYNADLSSAERDWPLSHIPILVAAEEWRALSAGLIERAELLEQVMADLYGPAQLVRDGLLPASLVAENPEWMRPLVGAAPQSGHFLHFLAFEVGRSPDGSWLVMGDRTQAPSGAGFALENRVATSKVFSDHYATANVERLAGFFRAFRDAMLPADGAGRAAILTPGPHTDTYFEHAYIARYLGLMLLEGEDLQVTSRGVMVQTVAGPQPVATLWRRLDSRFADPLELDEGSAIGTPGLVSAIRAGQVGLINALGSGVLESRAFLAFFPRIAERVLGRALAIPNIATWWCGQAAERAFVRANRDQMMLGLAHSAKMPFEPDQTTFSGAAMRDAAGAGLDALLDRDGAHMVGQESVRLSTTPAMVDGALMPRPMVIRVFAARTVDGWTVMPGGYARIGRSEDPTALAMQRGGSVSDVWVIGDQPVRTDSLTPTQSSVFVRRTQSALPARTADNLFWLGRYVERAEGIVRLLRAYHLRLDEAEGRVLPVLDRVAQVLKAYDVDRDDALPKVLLAVFDAARGCAGKVRERFSPDGWRALSDLSGSARGFAGVSPGDDAAQAHGVLLRKLAGFSGLVHENMFQDTGWRFLSLGRALERAEAMAHVLERLADPATPPGCFDVAVEIGDSQITHRRRYAVQTNRATIIDLLALDAQNPRGLTHQIETMRALEEALPRARQSHILSEPGRRLLTLSTDLAVARPDTLTTAKLSEIRTEIRALSMALSALYFG
ncbi:MAG: circularly permuted type 2 ATP-grasp protein [Pseudomonadota bacterium]